MQQKRHVGAFAGGVLNNPEKAIEVIAQESYRMVVTAPISKADADLDEMYLEYRDAPTASPEIVSKIADRYADKFYPLIVSDKHKYVAHTVKSLLESGKSNDPNHWKSRDSIITAYLTSQAIAGEGGRMLPLGYVFFQDDGQIDQVETEYSMRVIRARHSTDKRTLVLPGSYGFDKSRRANIIDDGGVDSVAAIAGRALDTAVDRWSMNTILSANPHKAPSAFPIENLTFLEASDEGLGRNTYESMQRYVGPVSFRFRGIDAPDLKGTELTNTVDDKSSNRVVAVMSGRTQEPGSDHLYLVGEGLKQNRNTFSRMAKYLLESYEIEAKITEVGSTAVRLCLEVDDDNSTQAYRILHDHMVTQGS